MGNSVQQNPLVTRSDLARAAVQLIEPLLPLLSPGKARLNLGDTGAVYAGDIAEMEAFARPLWAIVPMLAGGCPEVEPIWSVWKQGIIHGVDPGHPEYWGEVTDYDQRLVEMAVFGMGMAIAPQRFFHELPETAQRNLHAWLDQINHRDMPKNNWTFFRVLVNMGFMLCGLPADRARMEADFALIEEHYEGDGWYYDYLHQRDYYTHWAFHYYGMVYAAAMGERDPQHARAYVQRGALLAPQFACWFDRTGEALPYGRSLTYRFAQGAFFAAQAFAGAVTEEVDYGEMKHLLLGHMRRWFSHPIFTRDGVLTIGYHYPNLHMGEGYNAPGSPYWAMKAFLVLALPDEHPFWKAQERAFAAPEKSLQPHARMLITRSADGSHVLGYAAGNRASEHSHDEAKYEKFVYSTIFGFSVCKAQKLLRDAAMDNMLALSEEGRTYHPRYGCEEYALTETCVRSVWHPFVGVTIRTTVMPMGEWHIRRHEIDTDRMLYAAEGGFAIRRGRAGEAKLLEGKDCAVVSAAWGVSAIRAVSGYEAGVVVLPEANTNLMENRTLIPTLTATLKPGRHVLVCAVLGTATDADALNHPPEIKE